MGNLIPDLLAEYLKNLNFPFQGLGNDSGVRQFQPIVNVTVNKNRFDLGDSITFNWSVQPPLLGQQDLIKVFFKGLDSEDFTEVLLSGSVTFITDRDIYRLVIKAENRDKQASRTNGKLLLKKVNREDDNEPPIDDGIYLDETTARIIGLKVNTGYDLTLRIESQHYSGNYIDDVVYQFNINPFYESNLDSIYFQTIEQDLISYPFRDANFSGRDILWSFPEGWLFSEGGTYLPPLLQLVIKTDNPLQPIIDLVQTGIDFRPIPRPLPGNSEYLYDAIREIKITVIRLDEVVDLSPVISRLNNLDLKVTGLDTKVTDTVSRLNDLKDTIGEKVREIGENGQEVRRNFQETLENLKRNKKTQELINLLTLLVTLHNAAQLSSNVVSTLMAVVDLGLSVVGLTPKDDDGQPLSISTVIGEGTQDLLESLIGTETLESINQAWQQSNRAYQAAANVLSNLQSALLDISEGLEMTAQYNAELSNALKASGLVDNDLLNWQLPNPDFSTKFFTRLNQAEDVLSGMQMVLTGVKTAQDTIKDLENAKTEFDKAIDEAQKLLNKKAENLARLDTPKDIPESEDTDL
ncbi:hypothetical protein Syn6312_3036 [Synechococcus sp. PCC 6312]|nr:hypothetical protein Syn6312_3036 [Synechococcus sp. PCC 6312]